jgi:UDP-2,3-diacylglucosamine pyrophosphatase LpxH
VCVKHEGAVKLLWRFCDELQFYHFRVVLTSICHVQIGLCSYGHSNRPPMHYRTIFISDLHLGTRGCQAEALLEFLKDNESDYLYLIGDIFDGWQLRKKWYWPQAHNDIVQKLLRKARKGCKVIFIPGNHDEFARPFVGHAFGDIDVQREAVHVTANGKKMLVIHGDDFDGIIQCAKWLAYTGDTLYTIALTLNRVLNRLRRRLGLSYWSLSAYLKLKVKRAVSYIDSFEVAVAQAARERGLDGVVCGHIHNAEMRDIDGVLYCNDGDWVESLTALTEDSAGNLQILKWGERALPKALPTDTSVEERLVLEMFKSAKERL